MGETQQLSFSAELSAPASVVYTLWTTPLGVDLWLTNGSRVDARVDQPIFLNWNDGYFTAGRFTALDENAKVAFTWQGKDEPHASLVTVTLAESNGKTTLTLVHSGLGDSAAWTPLTVALNQRWENALEGLAYVVSVGDDYRYAMRPMIGFYPTGTQVVGEGEQGVTVGGVVEGTHAFSSGLQAGDVIVKINGQATPTGNDLAPALGDRKAEDDIDLEIVRDGVRQHLPLKLSKRTFPAVPATAAELSAQQATVNNDLKAELAQLLDGVTDDIAAHKPAENEWNLKEILAHLIWSQQFLHMQLWGITGGDSNVPWPANDRIPSAALRAHGRALADLRAEFESMLDRTVALVAAYPQVTVDNLAFYKQAGNHLFFDAVHIREHYRQIQATLESAKALAASA